MSARCRSEGVGSGSAATVRRATSLASCQFTDPSCGVIIACICPISAFRSGIPAPPAPVPPNAPPNAWNICSNGVPLNGLFGRRAVARVVCS